MSGGSDVAFPNPMPNSTIPRRRSGMLCACRQNEDDRAGSLHGITRARHQSSIGTGRHQPADRCTAHDSQRGRYPHHQAGLLCADCGRQQREKVRSEADLRKQS